MCQGNGHLSSECPKNENGLYPNGGGCKFCGSNKHLARNCNPAKPSDGHMIVDAATEMTGKGGDSDFVTDALQGIHSDRQKVKSEKKEIKKNNSGPKVVKF